MVTAQATGEVDGKVIFVRVLRQCRIKSKCKINHFDLLMKDDAEFNPLHSNLFL
jgi:hypothetical protein